MSDEHRSGHSGDSHGSHGSGSHGSGSHGSGSHRSGSRGSWSGKPNGRSGKGFKPRNGGRGRSYDPRAEKPRDEGESGGTGHDRPRRFGGSRSSEGFHKSSGEHGTHRNYRSGQDHRSAGFRHDEGDQRSGTGRSGARRSSAGRSDSQRRQYHRNDDDRHQQRTWHGDSSRSTGSNRQYGHPDRDHRDHRDSREQGERDGQRRTNPRYAKDRRDARTDRPRTDRPHTDRTRTERSGTDRPHTDGRRFDHQRSDRGGSGRRGSERQYADRRGNDAEQPRRNSDGTISFPSQNPYTDRRPGEPRMPKGMEWSMLSKDEKERLRGLAKEHAENIGLHILAAFALEEDDPEAAMAHATWVAKQASRIDFARETLAFIAYRQGNYKLAVREFRTAHRMNGYSDYLPFIADCERGLGEPKKAIDIALSDEAKSLQGESKAELFLVYAGALSDVGLGEKAIEVVHKLGRSKGLDGPYRMRAIQAEQLFLEELGRNEDAAKLDDVLDSLEQQYADVDDDESDVVIDYDLEDLPESLIEQIAHDDTTPDAAAADDAASQPDLAAQAEPAAQADSASQPDSAAQPDPAVQPDLPEDDRE